MFAIFEKIESDEALDIAVTEVRAVRRSRRAR